MKLFKFYPNLLVLIVLLALMSCESESKLNEDVVLGRWELREATRDGKATQSLDQLYFEFEQDGSMKSNLAGQTESGKYEIEDNKLSQKDNKLEVDYLIENLNDSVMTLTTTLRERNFKFVLEKVVKEE